MNGTALFFPGCKVVAGVPQGSAQLAAYLKRKLGVDPIGCCRVKHKELAAQDTALTVCNNCSNLISESAPMALRKPVWEVILEDRDFVYPDYGGERMTLQDCWFAFDNVRVQESIRELLARMNIGIVELAENREKTTFCGPNLLSECSASNKKLAPKRYTEHASMFRPMPEAEQKAFFEEHCRQYTTPRTVCYCKFCRDGIRMGGKEGVHILDLLFPTA